MIKCYTYTINITIDYPEPATNVLITTTTTTTISLEWIYQNNGSSPRIRVDIEIRRNDVLERTDIVQAQFATGLITSLLPLTTYSFTIFVVSDIGRSRPSMINGSTLSLS